MRHNGQSVVEYILLFAAVTIVLIIFMVPGGKMGTAIEDVLNGSFNMINTMAKETNILP